MAQGGGYDKAGQQADLFALGLVLVYLLTGQEPGQEGVHTHAGGLQPGAPMNPAASRLRI